MSINLVRLKSPLTSRSANPQDHKSIVPNPGASAGSAPNKPGVSLCLPLLLNEGAGSGDFHTPFS